MPFITLNQSTPNMPLVHDCAIFQNGFTTNLNRIHEDHIKVPSGQLKGKSVKQTLKELCRQGLLKEALEVFELGSHNALVSGSSDIYCFLLHACAKKKALSQGLHVHAHTIKYEVIPSIHLANNLIDMYIKCGCIKNARMVFDITFKRDVSTWTMMIGGYVQQQDCHQAVMFFYEMQQHGFSPNNVTYINALNACIIGGALGWGKYLHSFIIIARLHEDIVLGNNLIGMYAKCGSIDQSQKVFDTMPEWNVITWTTLISGYSQQGHGGDIVQLFKLFQQQGLKADKVMFITIFSACASTGTAEWAKCFHAHFIKSQFNLDTIIGSSLIVMYAEFQRMFDLHLVFDRIPVLDAGSWNTMIFAYGCYEEENVVIELFWKMHQYGLKPDKITYISMLSSAAVNIEYGKLIHAELRRNVLHMDRFVCGSLISMYVKWGSIEDACQVFSNMPIRDMVSWTAIMSAYSELGNYQQVLLLFDKMQSSGLKPDKVLFVDILLHVTKFEVGKQIHSHIISAGLELDLLVGSVLVGMYAKCSSIRDAHCIFEIMPLHDVNLWTAIISGYALQGESNEAISVFEKMRIDILHLEVFSYISILNACVNVGALGCVKHIHTHLINVGLIADICIGNSLIGTYFKCGSIVNARQVFDEMQDRDIISWNAMVSGYAHHGVGEEAMELFGEMQWHGFKPDRVTFISILVACTHLRLVNVARFLFDSMSYIHKISPTIEHYTCMVDLLGRAKLLHEAKAMIDTMPFEPDVVIWTSFLGACCIHCQVELAEYAVKQVSKLDPRNTSAYVLLSNIYAGKDEPT